MHNREALHQKVGKANFDLIYDLEDPREYFSTLEKDEPTEALVGAVAGADLLTVTGGVGYVTERTFERLLKRMVEGSGGRMPWVAAFALRWVSYDRISDVLSDYGLVTE